LGGLNPKYSNIVELQWYSNFGGVFLLAHKVEKQKKKSKTFQRELSQPLPYEQAFNKESSSRPLNPTAKHSLIPQNFLTAQMSPPLRLKSHPLRKFDVLNVKDLDTYRLIVSIEKLSLWLNGQLW